MYRRYAIVFSGILFFCAVCAVLSGCGSNTSSAEDQIRALVGQGELAAEDRSVRKLRAMLTEDYSDSHGYSKKNISNILRAIFFRHQSVHLLVRIQSITFPEGASASDPQQATLNVSVAMGGTPLPDNLEGARADFINFTVQLRKVDDEWLVYGADWRRAKVEDFI